MASEKTITLTTENFEEEVLKSEKPVLVDFWAPWCGPCRAVSPLMAQIADEFNGKAKVGKVNVDEQGELAARFRIMSIPTVMLYKDGQVIEKVVGARSKDEFEQMLNDNL